MSGSFVHATHNIDQERQTSLSLPYRNAKGRRTRTAVGRYCRVHWERQERKNKKND